MLSSKHIDLFFDKTINLYQKYKKKVMNSYLKFRNTMNIKFSLQISYLINILLKIIPLTFP